jgi:mannose-6-phosphate isomerase-like protein (cupin superfamily)
VDYPNDLFMLARRQADGVVEWHENQVDVFFVQSGTATLVVGGNMVGGETTNRMKNEADRSRAEFAARYPPVT